MQRLRQPLLGPRKSQRQARACTAASKSWQGGGELSAECRLRDPVTIPWTLLSQVQTCTAASRSSGETSSVPRARLNRQYTSGSGIMPPARSIRGRRKSASCACRPLPQQPCVRKERGGERNEAPMPHAPKWVGQLQLTDLKSPQTTSSASRHYSPPSPRAFQAAPPPLHHDQRPLLLEQQEWE